MRLHRPGVHPTALDAVEKKWMTSAKGRCSSLGKQMWPQVQTEVGIGFYQDPILGMTAHVVILSQRGDPVP
jgi:hypothetical protein